MLTVASRLRLTAAAGALALMLATVPVGTAAAPDPSGTPLDSAVCQISLTISTTTPVTMTLPGSLAALEAGTNYSITASSGTCTQVGSGTQPFLIAGSGTTSTTATCANFVVLGGGATVSIGNTPPYAVTMFVAGTSATSAWIMELTPIAPGSGGAGVATLTLQQAAIDACLRGGTSQLTFSGVAVFAAA